MLMWTELAFGSRDPGPNGPAQPRQLLDCRPQAHDPPADGSAEDAGMPQGVAPRLGVDAEAMRLLADGYASQELAVAGVDRVYLSMVPTREPEHFAVCRDATHVRAPAAGQAPGIGDRAGREIDHRDAPLPTVRHI